MLLFEGLFGVGGFFLVVYVIILFGFFFFGFGFGWGGLVKRFSLVLVVVGNFMEMYFSV